MRRISIILTALTLLVILTPCVLGQSQEPSDTQEEHGPYCTLVGDIPFGYVPGVVCAYWYALICGPLGIVVPIMDWCPFL